MSSQASRAVRAVSAPATATWLWTWSGICFWYRRDNSLFTCDGIEVGRFSGPEVYGPDGRYLGELRRAPDGYRLITSSYKKSYAKAPFVPKVDRPRVRATDRRKETIYCGYEDFPSREILTEMVRTFRAELRRYTNADSFQ